MLEILQTIAGTTWGHGGTSRSVPTLCDSLASLSEILKIGFIVGIPHDQNVSSNLPSAILKIVCVEESPLFGRLTVGRRFLAACRSLKDSWSLVHDHGVWLPSNHAMARYCNQSNIPRVVSPRGMLGEWALAHGKWKKRLAWHLYQRRDLATATAFHATSDQERDEIRALGFEQPIAVIPNGIDLPSQWPVRHPSDRFRVLFLSRVHPKKGLIPLVEAWKEANLPKHWMLTIAGPDENGHWSEVEARIQQLGLSHQITYRGPIDDRDKWQAYAEADLFVLPSHNENFGIVIAEAMASGLPVITSTSTPWSVLQEQQAGWWVAPSKEAIAAALLLASQCSLADLQAMGERGKEYVVQQFQWESVARQMLGFYNSILGAKQA